MASNLKERLLAAQAAGAAPNEELSPVFAGVPNAAAQGLERIPISLLDPWSSEEYNTQPFRMYDVAKMKDMMESMSEKGLLSPIIVRPLDGRYQILAGHNRVYCAQQLGWNEIDAIIKPGLSDEAAADIMVDTNFVQRDVILPSERAWGWKIKMDNLRHQGARSTSSHGGTKLRSDAQIGESEGKGRSTIQRYITLTRLIRPLLDIVDGYQYDPENPTEWTLISQKPMIPITAAERLVDLSEKDQGYLVELFVGRVITGLNKAQANELKAMRAVTYPGNPLDQAVIRRCLGIGTDIDADVDDAAVARPYVLKLSPLLFPSTNAIKYMGDAELQERIVHEIVRYVEEKEAKEGVD